MDQITAKRLRGLCAAARASKLLHDDDRAARDAEIHAAAEAGVGDREIQRATGETEPDRLSLSHVQRIIIVERGKAEAEWDSRVLQ